MHSFDFLKKNECMAAAGMCNVPLKDNHANIGVMCLVLMGTNTPDFIRETHRVLVPNGLLKIAEARSRFESSSNDNDNDDEEENDNNHSNSNGLKKNLNCVKLLGFTCEFVDRSSKMFF